VVTEDHRPVGRDPAGIAVGGGYVWVADNGDAAVTRIDPHTLATNPVSVGASPRSVVASSKAVWVANYASSSLTRIDPKTARRVGDDLAVDLNPSALALYDGALWLSALGSGTVQRVTF